MNPQQQGTSRVAAGIFVLFSSLYLLTMGGHTLAADDESLFYQTQSIVDRHDLAVSDDSEWTGATRRPGVDGRLYVAHSPMTSIFAIPFYVLGSHLAALGPPAYTEVIQRFGVGLLDPLLTGAACALVYLIAATLSFSTRIAVILAFAYGLGTLAWPYSKYFLSEPLTGAALLAAVLACIHAASARSRTAAVLAGIALGVAVGSKATAIATVPAFLLYVHLARRSEHDSVKISRLWITGAFIVGLGAILSVLVALNMARYGNPLETGYTPNGLGSIASWRSPSPIEGFLGLTISSGKGLLWYAPPAILGLLAFRRFFKRQPAEALLLGALGLVYLAVHMPLRMWHGDDSWGPRYLAPILGLLLIPAGELMRRSRGALAMAGLTVIGMLANLGGVLVSSNVYTQQTPGDLAEARRWDPSMSPILAHWKIFLSRWNEFSHRVQPPLAIVNGVYHVGPEADTSLPLWSRARTVLQVTPARPDIVELRVRYFSVRPAEIGDPDVRVSLGGEELASVVERLPDDRLELRSRLLAHQAFPRALVAIESDVWVPAQVMGSADTRELGIFLSEIVAEQQGQLLALGEPRVDHVPVSEARPWSPEARAWFYNRDRHLVDVWLWFLRYTELPGNLAWLALIPLAGLIGSAAYLYRTLRGISMKTVARTGEMPDERAAAALGPRASFTSHSR